MWTPRAAPLHRKTRPSRPQSRAGHSRVRTTAIRPTAAGAGTRYRSVPVLHCRPGRFVRRSCSPFPAGFRHPLGFPALSLALPVPHNFSLDFMKPRWRAWRFRSGRASLPKRCWTGVAGHHGPGADRVCKAFDFRDGRGRWQRASCCAALTDLGRPRLAASGSALLWRCVAASRTRWRRRLSRHGRRGSGLGAGWRPTSSALEHLMAHGTRAAPGPLSALNCGIWWAPGMAGWAGSGSRRVRGACGPATPDRLGRARACTGCWDCAGC